MNNGFRIGKLFGIEVKIDPSWIFIFLLVTWSLSISVFPRLQPEWGIALYWVMGISASLLFFASVLAHEFAHSLVAKARGLPIRSITLFLFGGVSNLEREPESPGTEFLMAIVGPLTSIGLGFLFLFLGTIGTAGNVFTIPNQFIAQLSPLQTMLLWLGSVNILVGMFNLIPGFPLDGGRVLRSILWSITHNLKMATRIAAFIGQSVGYTFIFAGILMAFGITIPFFGTGIGSGIWIALIGWFLSMAAGQSYQQVVLRDMLEDIPVKKLMRNKVTPISPNLSINKLVDEYMIGTDKHAFPVMSDSSLEGIVSIEDINKVPREEWEKKRVQQIMTPYNQLAVVAPQEDASEALNKITQKDIGQVPVVEKKKLLGMLSRRDILLWLALREKHGEIQGVPNTI